MKLADIPPGSDIAYRCAARQIAEQVEFELETCRRLLGAEPEKSSNFSPTRRIGASSLMTRSCELQFRLPCSTGIRPPRQIRPAKIQEKTKMATVMRRQDTEAAQQQTEPLRKAAQSLTCGTNRTRGTKPKYTWRPEYDAYLKAQYFGGLNRRFRVLNRMIRLTGLPRWYIKRQAARLGLTMHMDRKPWTRAELDVLADLVSRVSVATIAKRLHRPVSSVTNRLKRMQISRRVREGYTMRDLELCLGEDHRKIAGWIKRGWLQDRLQGTRRHDGNGRDIHRIRESDILNFIRSHPQEICLGKIDQTWFLDMVLLRGREVRQAKSSRAATKAEDDLAA
jgi:hypothetical protein